MPYIRSSLMSVTLCLLFIGTLQPNTAVAQSNMSAHEGAMNKGMMRSTGIDQDSMTGVMQKNEVSQHWGGSKNGIVSYHIIGVFQGQTNVAGDSNWTAYADVTDRVVIDLKWKLSDSKLEGIPSFQNTKSTVMNLRNPEPSCLPPLLEGAYEHYELQGIKQGLAGTLELQVQTIYPLVEVAQSCTGSRKTVPASNKTRLEELIIPSPLLLGMKLPDSVKFRISEDKKSLIHEQDGWSWTFTPIVVQ